MSDRKEIREDQKRWQEKHGKGCGCWLCKGN